MRFFFLRASCLAIGLIAGGTAFSSETGKTVYVPRLLSMDSTYDIAQYAYFQDTHPGNFSFSITPIYQQSQPSHSLGKVFLFNDQEKVRVTQAGGAGTVYKNAIYSEWMGLNAAPSTFNQTFSFTPQRKVWGSFFNFYGSYKRFWGAMIMPVICAEHRLEFSQNHAQALGDDPEVKTVKDALTQQSFRYGRMKNVKQQWGIDDIKIKLGALYYDSEEFQGRAYLQTLIPTGKKNQAKYIFNPRVGSKNWGLGSGLNFFWRFWKKEKNDLSLISDVNWVYRFQGNEMRSFDLKHNGAFSRYLLFVQRGAATTPLDGINELTSTASVTGRNAFEGLLALHGRFTTLNAEVGYDIFYRQAEKVRFKRWPKKDLGVFNPGEVLPSGTTSSQSTVGTSFTQAAIQHDPSFVSLTHSDIDLSSASHDAYLTNKFYGSLANDFTVNGYPLLLGVLGSYEFGPSNAELSQWSIAGQFSMEF